MFINENEIKEQLQELSILARQVYGIKEKQHVSYKEQPDFVRDVIRDMTNISYNLAIADHVSSEAEKELLLLAFKWIFYPHGKINHKFLQTIAAQFDEFEAPQPAVKSPIHIIEKAKHYDHTQNINNKDSIAKRMRELLVAYAEAVVEADGFQSVREFEVLETFRFWIAGDE